MANSHNYAIMLSFEYITISQKKHIYKLKKGAKAMIEKIKHGWTVFQESVYRRSQEVRVPILGLSLSKRAEIAHFNAYWYDGEALYMLNMILWLITAYYVVVLSSETVAKIIAGTVTTDELVSGAVLLVEMFFFLTFPMLTLLLKSR